MGLQRVRLTKEDTYGVFDTTSPVQQEIFLPVSNAMTVRVVPTFWMIPDAGQSNRLVRKNISRKNVGGRLQTYLFPSQAALLMSLAADLNGTAPCVDLPSFTLDHLIQTDDCVSIYRRYLGNKFGAFTLSGEASEQGAPISVSADIIGSTTAAITGTDYPIASVATYPDEDPYEFYHTAGLLKIGAVRTNYSSFSLNISNVTKPFMDENRYAQRVDFFGRVVTFSAELLYKTAADRAAFEDGTKQEVEIELNDGVSFLNINLGGVVNIDSIGDDLPLDSHFRQSISLTALIDAGTGTDLAYTAGTVTP